MVALEIYILRNLLKYIGGTSKGIAITSFYVSKPQTK